MKNHTTNAGETPRTTTAPNGATNLAEADEQAVSALIALAINAREDANRAVSVFLRAEDAALAPFRMAACRTRTALLNFAEQHKGAHSAPAVCVALLNVAVAAADRLRDVESIIRPAAKIEAHPEGCATENAPTGRNEELRVHLELPPQDEAGHGEGNAKAAPAAPVDLNAATAARKEAATIAMVNRHCLEEEAREAGAARRAAEEKAYAARMAAATPDSNPAPAPRSQADDVKEQLAAARVASAEARNNPPPESIPEPGDSPELTIARRRFAKLKILHADYKVADLEYLLARIECRSRTAIEEAHKKATYIHSEITDLSAA
jgi:hypothetical protein